MKMLDGLEEQKRGKYVYLQMSDCGNQRWRKKGKLSTRRTRDLCAALVLGDKELGAANQGLCHCILVIPSDPAPLLPLPSYCSLFLFSSKVLPVPLMDMT